MNIKNTTISFFLLFSITMFSQGITEKWNSKVESKTSYLDSIKMTFIKDDMASCVDSLWMKELTNLDLFSDLENDIKTINIDEKVDYELPTELLKARLQEMDAKSPFNIEYNQG
ncbi:MAG: lytic transglycosylase, partial [Bacteroidia bacterium]|nr:lytic transglycosylase [Bacteroidia bacterium]